MHEADNTDLLALEVSPGVLLRITSITGDKFFSEATQALDPSGSAGHLVSIVVAYGISNTPTALLANHMESSLAAAAAREGRILCQSWTQRLIIITLTRVKCVHVISL